MHDITGDLKKLSKSSNKIIKLLNNYSKCKENQVNNAYVLEKKLGDIEKIVTGLPDFGLKDRLSTWLKQERKEIETIKEDFRFSLGKELTTLFLKEGIKVKGQYPILRIGFYTLKINFQFGEAALFYGPEIEKIKSKIPLQPKIIYETVKKYDTRLHAIKSTPGEIFHDLYKAYKRRLTLANKPIGEKLLITDVLTEYVILKQTKRFNIDPQKTHFREFPRAQLSYLLYFLKKSNILEKGVKLHVATFDATVDKANSIWVPENEEGEGTHYSHISFESHGQ